jgi:hypothetical protein
MESLLGCDVSNPSHHSVTFAHIGWQEGHTDGVMASLRQLADHDLTKKLVRNLDKNASPITSSRISTGSATMIEVGENGQPLLDNLMGWLPIESRNEANTTGIMFIFR